MTRRALVVSACLMGVLATIAQGQEPTRQPVRVPPGDTAASAAVPRIFFPGPNAVLPDTSLASPLVRHVFATVSPYIARAARDTLTRAWRITLPDDEPPWPAVRAHLLVSLRGRPATAVDSQFYHLEVGSVRVSADTARSLITYGVKRICPDSTREPLLQRGGYTNVEDVYLTRSTHLGLTLWSAARSDVVRHGDLFGCRVDPKY